MTKQVKAHWTKVGAGYNKYWRSFGKQALLKKELDFISRFLSLSRSETVLDIGIGTGRILRRYLQSPTIRKIDGVDISPAMVKICREKYSHHPKIRQLAVCDIADQPLPFTANYDLISAIRVFKYIPTWKKAIGKISSRLNHDGVFIFSLPNLNSYLRFTRPDLKEYYSTPAEITQALADSGLKILGITSFSKLPDSIYNLARGQFSLRLLLRLESWLKLILKDMWGKEYFIAAGKIYSFQAREGF